MKKILYILLLILFAIPNLALAATFNPNYIISDNDLVNIETMSITHIQKFLSSKGGLGSYITINPWGNQKTAAQVIYDAGKYWHINPQYLIVRMQIEQSLITDPAPSPEQLDWATGYAVCDGCSKDDPDVKKFKGFFNQVNWAARILTSTELNSQGNPRGYLPHIAKLGYSVSGWGPGITKTTGDGYAVTPVNNATAALYTYTPYVYNANHNIWRYWNQWFTKHYPDGSLLQVQGEAGVYLIQYGKKRPFWSRTAFFSSYDSRRIIQVAKSDLDIYEEGAPIKFANYSLLEGPTGRIYLIVDNQKRYIVSPDVFRKIGFNPEEIIDVTANDLSSYANGEDITIESTYPTGALLQSIEIGGISFVQNGVRHSIWSREIFNSRFKNKQIIKADQASIDQYPLGEPIKFKDGELVTSPNANGVYVISNGQRRGIASKEVFESLGFKWENIIRTTDKALFIHPEGEKIDF